VPDSSIISLLDYGHLLPMEAPKLCAQIIQEHYQRSK
jgi:pimeloyl-ACP methyl ester carboxylesterase